MAETSEPIYTKEQAGILTAVAALQTELRLSREQQAKDNELFRDQASKDNTAIMTRLDKLGELVGKHSEWIAGKGPLCQAHLEKLEAIEGMVKANKADIETLQATVEETKGFLNGARGAWKLIAIISTLIGSAISGTVAFVYHITHLLPTTPKVP